MILERHQQKKMNRNYKTLYKKKAARKVCSVHMTSMNTALWPSHINQRENKGKQTCIQMILTIDVLPRESQDDKILPEHIRINPKYPFIYKIWNKKE